MDRRQTGMWMREVLDHLNRCCDQWQATEGPVDNYALDSMERDLAELQRVCRIARQLRQDSSFRAARAA